MGLSEPAATIPINKYVFELVERHAQKFISPAVLRSLRLYSNFDVILGQYKLMVEALIPAEKLEDVVRTTTYKFPLTWWQHFKREYFPKWLLKRFPVRYYYANRHFHCRSWALYPKFSKAIPDLGEWHITTTVEEIPGNDWHPDMEE